MDTVTAPARVVLDPVGAPHGAEGDPRRAVDGSRAVVGVPDVTLSISTGERITVLGAAGIIELE